MAVRGYSDEGLRALIFAKASEKAVPLLAVEFLGNSSGGTSRRRVLLRCDLHGDHEASAAKAVRGEICRSCAPLRHYQRGGGVDVNAGRAVLKGYVQESVRRGRPLDERETKEICGVRLSVVDRLLGLPSGASVSNRVTALNAAGAGLVWVPQIRGLTSDVAERYLALVARSNGT